MQNVMKFDIVLKLHSPQSICSTRTNIQTDIFQKYSNCVQENIEYQILKVWNFFENFF